MKTSNDYSWVKENQLCSVIESFATLDKQKELTPELLAELVKRLVKCEVKPGGPYRNKAGVVEINTNESIDRFFKNQGIVLPQLVSFLKSNNIEIPKLPFRLKSKPPTSSAASLATKMQNSAILAALHKDISTIALPARSVAKKQIKNILRIDKYYEISLISYFFEQSLRPPYRLSEESIATTLGVANVYCWASYVTYDDFFDDEGAPLLLPLANIAMRRSIRLYQRVLNNTTTVDINNIFDVMDQANTWELQNCRFVVTSDPVQEIYIDTLPDYKDRLILASRAWGHVTGPIILIDNLTGLQQKQITSMTRMLQHYLIAKQLCDDIHDWKKDLEAGHISYVVAQLLKGAAIQTGKYSLIDITENLQYHFWQSGFSKVAKTILVHTDAAKKCLTETGLFTTSSMFEQLILRTEISIQENLELYQAQQVFSKAYSK